MRSLFLLLLPAALVTGLISWLATSTDRGIQELSTPPVTLKCTQPPVPNVVFEHEANAVRPLPGGWVSLQGESMVSVDFCRAGTLTLTVRGIPAGGAAPQLRATFNDRVLLSEAFDGTRTVQLTLPEPGRLTLYYPNDYYRSDARVGTVEVGQVEGDGCSGLAAVTVPPETGGVWDPLRSAATMTTTVPATLTPCGPGRMSLLVLGRPGGGVFPRLKFMQDGQVLREITTAATRQQVVLQVKATPVSVALVNPYFVEEADRNLDLLRLAFQPTVSQ